MKTTKYDTQAEKFLQDTKTSLMVVLATPQKSPLWAKKGEKHGINYSVTLENSRHKYSFDFWASIKDREVYEAVESYNKFNPFPTPEDFRSMDIIKKETLNNPKVSIDNIRKDKKAVLESLKPKTYNILACLNPLQENNFEEFCNSFGYDTDSINALKVYEACERQDNQLRKLWSMDELEKLQEIN